MDEQNDQLAHGDLQRTPHLPTVTGSSESDETRRIERVDTLSPGYYWRAKVNIELDGHVVIRKGDVHLLLDVFMFDGADHTVHLLTHPRDGADGEITLLVQDFLNDMEPAPDGEAVRAREQQELLASADGIRDEMLRAESDPLSLPGLTEAVEKEIEKMQQEALAAQTSAQRDEKERRRDIAKIHRRAARRSAAAGNPLVPKGITISDRLDAMIAGGVNSEGLDELLAEADRRRAVATATAKWLEAKAERMTRTMQRLSPFYAEKGRVALARAKRTVDYVKQVSAGLRSLRLYTGDGVEVVTIREGKAAPACEPLTLVQTKRFAGEELAAWADVDETFDWQSEGVFFEALRTNDNLLHQVLPAERCVATVATSRTRRDYSSLSDFEAAMNNIRNRMVWLLVRNGENVHVVYSGEPSHEAAARLYPNSEETAAPFRGLDGSQVGIQDLRFQKSMEHAEAQALHYRRFLLLLCGLDHRQKLFGEFYPPEEALRFMTLDFQQRHMRFMNDDEPGLQIGEPLPDVLTWIADCNKAVQSGSRIVSTAQSLGAHSPQVKRIYSVDVDATTLPKALVVQREKKRHFVTVPTRDRHDGQVGTAKVWLEEDERSARHTDWFLCLDRVPLHRIRRYIQSRNSRAMGIAWLRTFKRAAEVLLQDQAQESRLRAHLRDISVAHGVLDEERVGAAIDSAISSWRAAHRGAPAPTVEDVAAVQELYTLLYPAEKIVAAGEEKLQALIEAERYVPLKLTRTGKTRLVLYVEASEVDRAPFGTGVRWGWVKRLALDYRKTKVTVASSSLCWLRADKPDATEEVVRTWPGLASWEHRRGEPCSLRDLELFMKQLRSTEARWAEVLRRHQEPDRLTTEEVEDLAGRSRKLLLDAGGYSTVFCKLPVGVYQGVDEEQAHFLYMCCSVAGVINGYADEVGRQLYRKRGVPWRGRDGELEHQPTWFLRESVGELVPLVGFDRGRAPSFAQLESHERGGYRLRDRRFHYQQSRAQRRENNGSPAHQRATVVLSLNRAIDALLGRAAHLRRAFYAELKRQESWDFRFEARTPEVRARLVALRTKRYEAPQRAYALSSLIINQGRGVANTYFVQKRRRK